MRSSEWVDQVGISSGNQALTRCAFTGTDRGLLRSVLGPWSPVPKCEASGAPISVEEHTSMAPRPRCQSQNPPFQRSFAIPALPWPSKPRLRYSPGLAPTTLLNALLNAASDSYAKRAITRSEIHNTGFFAL